MDQKHIQSLQWQLARWYGLNHRKLPWRASPAPRQRQASRMKDVNPYHVMVSEAMLQQTQVATVIDYFNRFINVFPDLPALANADEAEVMHQWQGLGYYRRARFLHQAAQYIDKEYAGKMPGDIEGLRQLPGVGPYTAGAIASIAFGVRTPLVDGNVVRVLSRLFALKVAANDTGKIVWDMAEKLLPDRDHKTRGILRNPVGDFNQALMELGATVCHAKKPACSSCPWQSRCKAYASDQTDKYPLPVIRQAPKKAVHHVLLILKNKTKPHIYLRQRRSSGLWANMWEMPSSEHLLNAKVGSIPVFEDYNKALGFLVKTKLEKGETGEVLAYFSSFAEAPEPPAIMGQFKHQTTHRTITFVFWRIHIKRGSLKEVAHALPDGDWYPVDGLLTRKDLPMSNPQRKILEHLEY